MFIKKDLHGPVFFSIVMLMEFGSLKCMPTVSDKILLRPILKKYELCYLRENIIFDVKTLNCLEKTQ